MGRDVLGTVKGLLGSIPEATREEQLRHAIEVGVFAATCDGKLDDEELRALARKMQQVLGTEVSFQRVALAAERLNELGTDTSNFKRYIQRAGGAITDPALRRGMYQLAVWCAVYDGHINTGEAAFLKNLREAYELSDADAHALEQGVMS